MIIWKIQKKPFMLILHRLCHNSLFQKIIYFIRIPQLAAGMETSSGTVVKLHYFKSTGANISSTFNWMRHH